MTTSPANLPNSRPPAIALVPMVVTLRENADSMAARLQRLDAATALTETRALVESACAAVQRIHETTHTRAASAGLARAEAFALRELAAARRHQDLAGKSGETCRAACELAVRAVLRALDPGIPERWYERLTECIEALPEYGVLIPGWSQLTRPGDGSRPAIRAIIALPRHALTSYLERLGWPGGAITYVDAALRAHHPAPRDGADGAHPCRLEGGTGHGLQPNQRQRHTTDRARLFHPVQHPGALAPREGRSVGRVRDGATADVVLQMRLIRVTGAPAQGSGRRSSAG